MDSTTIHSRGGEIESLNFDRNRTHHCCDCYSARKKSADEQLTYTGKDAFQASRLFCFMAAIGRNIQ